MRAVSFALVSVFCAALLAPAWADNDKDKGKGHGKGHGGVQQGDARGAPAQFVIVDRDRSTVRTYYRTEFVAGNCPPGLAKKNNGCLPPGQAKKMWSVGQPLPPTIAYYPLPPVLYGQLTPPPVGYNYVRVDDDILLLAISTRIIAGALGNLGQLND